METGATGISRDQTSVYVFPVQVKGGKDAINIVQIMQDIAMCRDKFPSLVCHPIAAQFMPETMIAMFEFEYTGEQFGIAIEKHYRLVPADSVTEEDLETYRRRSE